MVVRWWHNGGSVLARYCCLSFTRQLTDRCCRRVCRWWDTGQGLLKYMSASNYAYYLELTVGDSAFGTLVSYKHLLDPSWQSHVYRGGVEIFHEYTIRITMEQSSKHQRSRWCDLKLVEGIYLRGWSWKGRPYHDGSWLCGNTTETIVWLQPVLACWLYDWSWSTCGQW